ncbi:hypothetical protein [Pseudomonas sp. DP-17]|uniref:hypothetical protein n=1 Tax=Pseudomonas sp. DP-17 TaxID=1580486 RepID=UPI001EFB96CB|nr:hypothetical protein [Pseudomonas sp. DP-17]MCG8910949.1 hypothetical protein [Pseudomonas sp. DP-17]
MTQSTVLCHCCGRHMVPQVVRSRGIYVGWEWGGRIGAGHPIDSVCPFCLSSNWDGVKRPVHRSPGQKLLLVLILYIAGQVMNNVVSAIYSLAGKSAIYIEYKGMISAAIVFLLFLAYRKYRFEKQSI